jgi:hypothetical protein
VYCKGGQKSEEEMLENSQGSENFEHFLHLLGNNVKLQGFKGYKGDLDIKCEWEMFGKRVNCIVNAHGTNSVYTKYKDHEISK